MVLEECADDSIQSARKEAGKSGLEPEREDRKLC